MKRGTVISLLLAALTLLPVPTAHTATFQVNSAADSHDVSPGDGLAADHTNPDSARTTLRAAVEEASAHSGPDTILVPAGVTPIHLSLGSLELTGNSTAILGSAGLGVIDGLNNVRFAATMIISGDSNRLSGLTLRRARGNAVEITGADNVVGGSTSDRRVVLIGNGLDMSDAAAVAISGSAAHDNVVEGCWIGLYGNGFLADGNHIGVQITQNAHSNRIGGPASAQRNLISGNNGWGIVISGSATTNTITGNFIGPDVSGDRGPGNDSGAILIASGGNGNIIGGVDRASGNLISANSGDAVRLAGGDVYGNTITGNFIGVEATGRLRLANGGHGVAILDGSHDNTVGGSGPEEGNIISGNQGHGVLISGRGSDRNVLLGNLIGIDIRGYSVLGNIDGVRIDKGARDNRIGGATAGARNTISGNGNFGVHLSGSGTSDNTVTGNHIGTYSNGLSSAPNSAGVVIDSGASSNTVGGLDPGEGNLISGNRAELFPYGAGVMLLGEGTQCNDILGNKIGLDIDGARSLRNGSAGVVIADGAQSNVIGGDSPEARNVISGNGSADLSVGLAAGIHLFGIRTSHNEIRGNWIGLSTNGLSVLPNIGHGVGLFSGASDNTIGGESPADGNVITGSDYHGLYIDGSITQRNLVRNNRIYNNDSLGFTLGNRAQGGLTPPIITHASPDSARGIGAPPRGRVDIYLADPDKFGAGEGREIVGSTEADESGYFAAALVGVTLSDTLTAIAIDSSNNSSAFSHNVPADPLLGVEEQVDLLPGEFSLSQNYPNPFNPYTYISYGLPYRCHVVLELFNIQGQRVRTLVDEVQSAEAYTVMWDATTNDGSPVATGVYIYRLRAGGRHAERKLLLLK